MNRDNREEPGYYAIVPATVRYDKSLPQGAKLLYGEITALCNKKGFCWAKNKYFSELYETTERTIIGWIQRLRDAGHITISFEYFPDSKKIKERFIYLPKQKTKQAAEPKTVGTDLVLKKFSPPEDLVVKKSSPLEDLVMKKSSPPSAEEIFLDNNTAPNNKKAAAADPSPQKIEKPPEKAAAENLQGENQKPPEISKQDVKKLNDHLLHLDSTLEHFDDEFYLKVLGFLDGHNLGLDYVTWFYKYICRERKLRSVRDYFFKVFLNTRYIGLFREETKPKPARTVAMTACPSCSLEHEAASQYCPQCSLSKDRRNDTGEIMFRRKLFGLDGKTREDYDSEYFLIIGNSNSIPEKSKQIAVLNHKYGLL